jgi:hypothetical protein
VSRLTVLHKFEWTISQWSRTQSTRVYIEEEEPFYCLSLCARECCQRYNSNRLRKHNYKFGRLSEQNTIGGKAVRVGQSDPIFSLVNSPVHTRPPFPRPQCLPCWVRPITIQVPKEGFNFFSFFSINNKMTMVFGRSDCGVRLL